MRFVECLCDMKLFSIASTPSVRPRRPSVLTDRWSLNSFSAPNSLACIKCAYLMQAGADDRRRRVLELVDTFQRCVAMFVHVKRTSCGYVHAKGLI